MGIWKDKSRNSLAVHSNVSEGQERTGWQLLCLWVFCIQHNLGLLWHASERTLHVYAVHTVIALYVWWMGVYTAHLHVQYDPKQQQVYFGLSVSAVQLHIVGLAVLLLVPTQV